MAISDLAQNAAATGKPWRTCFTCDALATLPPAEAKALRDLLANPRVRYTELAVALRSDADNPLDIDATNLARHARGGCKAREKLR